MPHVMGSIEVYEQQTTHPVVLGKFRVAVLWGGVRIPMNTLKIAWSSTDGSGLEFFHKLKKFGKQSSLSTQCALKLSISFGDAVQWIAPRPDD